MRELNLEKDLKYCIKKIMLVPVFLGIIGIISVGCSGGDTSLDQADLQPKNEPVTESVFDAKASSMLAPDAAGNDNEMSSIDETELSPENDKMVNLAIEDYGRPNPFLPPSEAIEMARAASSALPYELIDPPQDATADSDASRIINTKVSGILYDDHNPAAILNMDGTDYLVRTGDVINNYKVLAIYKTNVAVQLGDNIYKAGVGELLAENKINHNVVPNLERRFGGAK